MSAPFRLLADVGGTNCRFAALADDGTITPLTRFETRSVDGPLEALARALGPERRASAIALAIACPLEGDLVRMVNARWSFSIAAIARQLHAPLVVTNDFVAQSYALPALPQRSLEPVGPILPSVDGTRVVLGPGTGLGVGIVVPHEGRFQAMPSEGGHVSAAARDEDEEIVLAFARTRHAHVSYERLVSGPGLELIHEALAKHLGATPAIRDAATICALPDDPLCRATMRALSTFLGTIASDLALVTSAFGGVYLTGGVLGHLGAGFDAAAFRRRFEAKGRYASLLARIPTYRIVDPLAPFRGLAQVLARVDAGDLPAGVVTAGFR